MNEIYEHFGDSLAREKFRHKYKEAKKVKDVDQVKWALLPLLVVPI